MSTLGSRATTIGLTFMLLSVSGAMLLLLGSDGLGVLICFVGVLVGASLIAVGVHMVDGPAPIVPMTSARALAAFVRRNIASVGLVMASCTVAALPGEEDTVVCFGMFALLLLGLTFVNIGARGE